MLEILKNTWPWYISGAMLTLVMGLLLFLGKSFGLSSTLRHMCAIGGAGKRIPFFNYDWRQYNWNMVLILGAIIGGFIGSTVLKNPEPIQLSEATIHDLAELGFSTQTTNLAPTEIFNWSGLLTLKGFVFMIIGGFLVGFGTRYAAGCTSGHAISGLSNLQISSLIAVAGFFIGGLIVTYVVIPVVASF
ncbi:MAG: YeeE/YedE family protein [Bacteroidetes bacterium]|nr:YeeE/YedE family protein [Bacteroidota bacterium]